MKRGLIYCNNPIYNNTVSMPIATSSGIAQNSGMANRAAFLITQLQAPEKYKPVYPAPSIHALKTSIVIR